MIYIVELVFLFCGMAPASGIPAEKDAAPKTEDRAMFAGLLMMVGTVISVLATLEFLRPVPRNTPFGL